MFPLEMLLVLVWGSTGDAVGQWSYFYWDCFLTLFLFLLGRLLALPGLLLVLASP